MTDTAETIFDPPTDPDPLDCPDCPYHARSKVGLGLHRRKAHGVIGEWATGHKSEQAPKDPNAPAESRPKQIRGRVKLDSLGERLAGGLAWVATQSGRYPTGRVLQLEAPAIGPAFDVAIKGTMLDRPLQPLARFLNTGSEFGALAGLPVATEAFCRRPNPMTHAAFVSALELALPHIISSLKTAKKKQEKIEADLAQFAELFGKEPGEPMTISDLAAWIFAPPPNVPPPDEPLVEEPTAAQEMFG